MNFLLSGPHQFWMPTKKFDGERSWRAQFWRESAPKLANAIGCYVCCVNNKPVYVGKTIRQTFQHEIFSAPHKVGIYKSVIDTYSNTPRSEIFLFAKRTKGDGYAKRSGATSNLHRDIDFLEDLLIAYGLERNPNLENDRRTFLLRNMIVPGLLNSPVGAPARAVSSLKEAFGLSN